MNRIAIALVVSGALALSACAKKAPEELPPPPPPAPVEVPPPPPPPSGPQPGSQAHFLSAMGGSDTIYFDTDMSDIDADDQAALQKQAAYLLQYPTVRATIEGHCDERGTRDYNLALGERRANAAKNYLVSVGVDASRLTTVSYGKERPVALGSDEVSWAQNRRAASITMN